MHILSGARVCKSKCEGWWWWWLLACARGPGGICGRLLASLFGFFWERKINIQYVLWRAIWFPVLNRFGAGNLIDTASFGVASEDILLKCTKDHSLGGNSR